MSGVPLDVPYLRPVPLSLSAPYRRGRPFPSFYSGCRDAFFPLHTLGRTEVRGPPRCKHYAQAVHKDVERERGWAVPNMRIFAESVASVHSLLRKRVLDVVSLRPGGSLCPPTAFAQAEPCAGCPAMSAGSAFLPTPRLSAEEAAEASPRTSTGSTSPAYGTGADATALSPPLPARSAAAVAAAGWTSNRRATPFLVLGWIALSSTVILNSESLPLDHVFEESADRAERLQTDISSSTRVSTIRSP